MLRYELKKTKNVFMSESKLVEEMASQIKEIPKQDKSILIKGKSNLKGLIKMLRGYGKGKK